MHAAKDSPWCRSGEPPGPAVFQRPLQSTVFLLCSTTETSEDAAETSTRLELDLVLDALSELSGEDGGDWVRVRCVQALTSLQLWRLEELLEDWESMGVIRRDDTRLWMPSMRRIAGGGVGRAAPSAPKSRSAVNQKYPIEHGAVTNWDDTERNLASFFPAATAGRPKMPDILVGIKQKVS